MDLNVKVPALEKLVDYTASGIGAVAGPMLAPWKARKEAEARLIESKAEADSLKLIADAQAEARHSLVESDEAGRGVLEIGQDGIRQRIEFQERKRQANITSVVRDAAAELGDKEVPDREPDHDWTARFFDGVQDVSSEDMRKLWANILSGEVEEPGRTSLRTLDILKNMTKEDAQIFKGVCDYVIDDFVFYPHEFQTGHPKLSFNNIIHLQNAGLLHASSMLVKNLPFSEKRSNFLFLHQECILKISASNGQNNIQVPQVLLTSSGKELHRIVECAPDGKYLHSFAKFLQEKNVSWPTLASSRDILMGKSRIRFLLFPSNPSRTNRATARHDSQRYPPDRNRVSAGAGIARFRPREERSARAHLDAAYLAGTAAFGGVPGGADRGAAARPG